MKDITKYLKEKTEEQINVSGIFLGMIKLMIMSIISFHMLGLMKNIGPEFLSPGISSGFKFMMILGFSAIIIGILLNLKNIYHCSGINYEFNIHSLNGQIRSKSKLHGSFILGCGSINGETECIDYFVFFKEGEFGLIKDKIEQYDVQVVQTNEVSPSYKEVWVENAIKKILFVPKNTIKKQITIN